jgi:hypothetical protein
MGSIYNVTLRFRGVVEQKTYSGVVAGVTATGTNGSSFVVGGMPAADGYNVYMLAISSPKQVAYLNAGSSNVNQCWAIDYTVTLPMLSGATIVMTADTIDQYEVFNQDANGNPIVVPNIPPAPNSFDGQFVQMDVVQVIAAL